jgi:hypothetical protein
VFDTRHVAVVGCGFLLQVQDDAVGWWHPVATSCSVGSRWTKVLLMLLDPGEVVPFLFLAALPPVLAGCGAPNTNHGAVAFSLTGHPQQLLKPLPPARNVFVDCLPRGSIRYKYKL